MEKFRDFIIELAETFPNAPSNPAFKTLFQHRLNKWFSEYKTPDHPPYSAMIERALSELNEKNGSTGDEISQFIIKEYDALPWAHLTLLESHLDTLNKSGDIVLTRGKRYMLAEENSFLTSSTKDRKKKCKRKSRWAWERDINKRRKKRNQPKGNRFDLIEEHEGSDEKLTGNDVNNEKNYNDGMMAVTEMENSREMPQELEINLSEIMNGHICGADKEEKQEEGKTNDNQLAVSSPEKPLGFESTVVENLSDSGIFLRTCLCPQEQSFVVGERELDLPIDDKKPDSPSEPSVHKLSVSEKFLEITKFSDAKGFSEAHEMAVPVEERNPKSVEVHETVCNTSVSSDRRCKNSRCPKAEVISNIQFPKLQSGIVSVSASAEEISTWERMERQQTHWGLHSPKTVSFIGPDISPSPNSNDHQLPWLKLSDVEMPEDQREESVSSPNPEQHFLNEKPHFDLLEADILKVAESVIIESKPNEIKVYSRRTNRRPEQSQNTIQVVKSDVNLLKPNAIVDSRNSSMNEHEPELLRQPPMESDVNLLEPNGILDSQNSFMKEHETQELLQQSPVVQGEALRDKPLHDEGVSLIDVLEPKHQPEEFQKTVLKRRGRPPKHKPIIGKQSDMNLFEPSAIVDSQNSSMNEHQPRELLQQQPLVSGEPLRDKPSRDEDASLIVVLQPEHQPEVCQKTLLKRRGRPPKRKPIIGMCKMLSPSLSQELKNANQLQQEPPKRQTRHATKVEADVMVRGNVKSIYSLKADATTTDDLLLLDDLVPLPKLRPGRPTKC